MASITINSVVFNPTPSGPVTVNFRYKKQGDPDVNYVPVPNGTGVAVPANGTLTTPLVIASLLPSQAYTIDMTSTCGTQHFSKDVTTLAPPCPSITDMGATAG